jgi:hypothetical protein
MEEAERIAREEHGAGILLIFTFAACSLFGSSQLVGFFSIGPSSF